jgi:PPK2 family polyphosphate:nucleotide phosphotransferase
MKLKPPYRIKPGTKVRLAKLSTSETGGYKSERAASAALAKHCTALAALQEVLYACQTKALLIVLQGMDTSGKDGTIHHIFSGVNPQGCDVTAFKVPTPLEARHDFLWRAHAAVPPRGTIGIFNRSHYEDVLVPAAHKLVPLSTIRKRIDDINEFEDMLVDNDVVILKFFLHISREEQARRLQSRLDDPDKHWKLDPADFRERQFWKEYGEAYERILATTSPKHAPWFVIPSDQKWYRNVVISGILVDAMKALRLRYPKPVVDPATLRL